MHHHPDRLRRLVEEPARLDHLEALVHHRRGVDGDLGSHPPGWMPERDLRGRAGHLGGRGRAERTAGGGQPDAADGIPPVGETLVNRGMLAVHRNQPGAGRGRGAGHHRPGGHQRFLVGEADDLAGAKGGEGRAESRRPDDSRDDEPGARRGGGPLKPAGPSHHLEPREPAPVGVFEPLRLLFPAEGHELWPVALAQRVQPIGTAAGGERDDPEPVRVAVHHLESRRTDRARRPQDGNTAGFGAHRFVFNRVMPASPSARRL